MERTLIKKCRGNAYLGSFCKSKLAATCISGAVRGLLDPFHELYVFPPLKLSTIRLLMSAPRDVSLAGFSTPKGKVDRLALSIKKILQHRDYKLVSGFPAYYYYEVRQKLSMAFLTKN